ncbi:MAG: OmpA family protein [Siphonobacter sp.]
MLLLHSLFFGCLVAHGQNSPADELAPVFSAGGDTLFFVRDRHTQTIGKQDIWFISRNESGVWSNPYPFSSFNNIHDNAIVAQVADKLYVSNVFYGKKARPGLSVSRFDNGHWSSPEEVILPGLQASSGSIGFHLVGDSLLFIAMPDQNRSDDDLFISRKNPSGEWSEPRWLGSDLNSDENDFSPFWAEDGYLYFASERSGNSDLYRSRPLNKSWLDWSAPEPLTSLNTTGFEAYFCIDPKDKSIYFAQALPDSSHTDLIHRTSLSEGTLVFAGKELSFPILSNSPSPTELALRTLRAGQVYFDYRSYQLSPESQALLMRMVKHAQEEHPPVIEVVGFADAVGETEANLLISQRRALVVEKFLHDHGLTNSVELKAEGNTKAQLPASRSEADRRRDRRVEIRFLKEKQ